MTAVAICGTMAAISVGLIGSHWGGKSPEKAGERETRQSKAVELPQAPSTTRIVEERNPARSIEVAAPAPGRGSDNQSQNRLAAVDVQAPGKGSGMSSKAGDRLSSISPPPLPQPDDPVAAVQQEIASLKKESLEIADRLMQEYPNSADAFDLLGSVYRLIGETSKAWPCWEKALSRDPRRADVCIAMAGAALSEGEYDKAAELCRSGLARSNDVWYLRFQLAKALQGLGRPEEAIHELQLAIAAFSKDDESYILLGQSYALLKEYGKAKTSYERAVELNPGNPSAHYGLAIACARLGLADQSKQSMEQYAKCAAKSTKQREFSRDAAEYRRALAVTCDHAATIYMRHQKPADAERLLRRGAAVDSQFKPCRFHAVLLLLNTHRAEEAVQPAKELIAIDPKQARFLMLLATVYGELGRFDDALAAAKKALEMDPGNDEYRGILRKLQERR